MSTYNDMISTIMIGLSQDYVYDQVLQNITEEEISVMLDEMLQSNGITPTNIPSHKVLWIRMKVMEQVYWKLALASAPLYDVTIDGVAAKRNIRFDHYMKLIDAISKAIASMEADDPTLGGATARTYETYIDKTYNHNAYVTAQNIPKIEVLLDSTEGQNSNISLDLRACKGSFLKYEVYYCKKPIIDEYDNCSINKTATLLIEECNIHSNKLRVPISVGYVACVVTLKNGLKAYHELQLDGWS